MIEGRAVLERKRVPDFLWSLFEGRLFTQASRLAGSPLRPFLILEGTTSEWTRRQVRREAIQGRCSCCLWCMESPCSGLKVRARRRD